MDILKLKEGDEVILHSLQWLESKGLIRPEERFGGHYPYIQVCHIGGVLISKNMVRNWKSGHIVMSSYSSVLISAGLISYYKPEWICRRKRKRD